MEEYCTVLNCTAHSTTVQYDSILYSASQCSALQAWYCIVQQQHSTVQDSAHYCSEGRSAHLVRNIIRHFYTIDFIKIVLNRFRYLEFVSPLPHRPDTCDENMEEVREREKERERKRE